MIDETVPIPLIIGFLNRRANNRLTNFWSSVHYICIWSWNSTSFLELMQQPPSAHAKKKKKRKNKSNIPYIGSICYETGLRSWTKTHGALCRNFYLPDPKSFQHSWLHCHIKIKRWKDTDAGGLRKTKKKFRAVPIEFCKVTLKRGLSECEHSERRKKKKDK